MKSSVYFLALSSALALAPSAHAVDKQGNLEVDDTVTAFCARRWTDDLNFTKNGYYGTLSGTFRVTSVETPAQHPEGDGTATLSGGFDNIELSQAQADGSGMNFNKLKDQYKGSPSGEATLLWEIDNGAPIGAQLKVTQWTSSSGDSKDLTSVIVDNFGESDPALQSSATYKGNAYAMACDLVVKDTSCESHHDMISFDTQGGGAKLSFGSDCDPSTREHYWSVQWTPLSADNQAGPTLSVDSRKYPADRPALEAAIANMVINMPSDLQTNIDVAAGGIVEAAENQTDPTNQAHYLQVATDKIEQTILESHPAPTPAPVQK